MIRRRLVLFGNSQRLGVTLYLDQPRDDALYQMQAQWGSDKWYALAPQWIKRAAARCITQHYWLRAMLLNGRPMKLIYSQLRTYCPDRAPRYVPGYVRSGLFGRLKLCPYLWARPPRSLEVLTLVDSLLIPMLEDGFVPANRGASYG